MKGFDATKFPAGLLLAAGLLHFFPLFATPLFFVALAIGGYMATAFNLKGLGAGAAIVAGVVLFQAFIADTGVAPVQDIAESVPSLGELSSSLGG